MIIEGISFDPLLKARSKFEIFRHNVSLQVDYANLNLEEEQKRAGAIQAFEYCYELSWKTMRKVLMNKGVIANSPKDTFRAAAKINLIDDPDNWFDFIDLRNTTVHTYDERKASEVIQAFEQFSDSLTRFLQKVGAI